MPAEPDHASHIESRPGDGATFAGLFERHRRELQAHCYRLLGSVDESEELVQETFLRAWRARHSFQGRATMRGWLYRIATNACLDVIARRRRRVLPYALSAASAPEVEGTPLVDQAWLQPYPDRLLEQVEHDPAVAVVARETIELAFVAALQLLPPRQRAVLVLRDVLGWPAADIAGALATTVVAVNSAAQRARTTIRTQLGTRASWSRPAGLGDSERDILARFVSALENADAAAIAELLLVDARGAMPPYPMWYAGRDDLVATLRRGFALFGGFRVLPTRANRCPALALYRRPHGAGETAPYEAVGISVLTIEAAGIAEITSFMDGNLVTHFALPAFLR